MLCFSSAISGGSRGRAAPGRPVCPPSPHVPRSPGAPARPRPSPSSWSDFLARKPARQPLAEQQRESLGGTLGACHTHRPRTALCLPPAGRLPPPPCSHPRLPASAPSASLLPACSPPPPAHRFARQPAATERAPMTGQRHCVTSRPPRAGPLKPCHGRGPAGTLSSAPHTL